MLASGPPVATGFVPVLRYRDVAAAADWLSQAFGFERNCTIRDGDGDVIYAQLTCGSGLIMLVPIGQSELDGLMCQPEDAGGLETQACYVAVSDAEAHHASAVAAGATILLGLTRDDRGRAGYTCRDLEGHIWSFGTYDPGAAAKPAGGDSSSAGPAVAAESARSLRVKQAGSLGALMAGAVLGAVAAYLVIVAAKAAHEFPRVTADASLADPIAALDAATAELADTKRALADERSAREAAERATSAKLRELETSRELAMADRSKALEQARAAEMAAQSELKARQVAEGALEAVERQLEQEMLQRASAREGSSAKALLESAAPPPATEKSDGSGYAHGREAAAVGPHPVAVPAAAAPDAPVASPDSPPSASSAKPESGPASAQSATKPDRVEPATLEKPKPRPVKKPRPATAAKARAPQKAVLEPQENQWPYSSW